MGPHAGVYLAERIVAHTRAGGDSGHVSMVLSSRPSEIADRSTYLADPTSPSPSPGIWDVALELIQGGATVLGMPCNTAHAHPILDPVLDRLSAEHPEVRFLHLIRETVEYCGQAAPDARKIGVLATLGTYRTRLYANTLEEAGLIPVVPDPDVQRDLVHRSLYDPAFGIKFGSDPVSEEALELLSLATEHLIEGGAEAVILGCTELPLAIPGRTFSGIPVVDSTTALARALIAAVAPEKLKVLAN